MTTLSRDHASRSPGDNCDDEQRGFLPDISGLEPDVVMLVVNDGWDIRALKEARSLAGKGLSVVLGGWWKAGGFGIVPRSWHGCNSCTRGLSL